MKNKYIPAWMKDSVASAKAFLDRIGQEESSRDEEEKEAPQTPQDPSLEAAAVAVASSVASSGEEKNEQELMVLTKKLIEIRALLNSVDQNTSSIKLPSIVVIGSQSSGKSSVLEAIVGHEFLPKGQNMVTRRPIELTLIHSPMVSEEFGEFPQLGIGKIKDFSKIQKTLTDLNLAVPESECVSETPIQLRIYSPNVPDLSLIDLPGYIQIHTKNQPPILREKIQQLCEKYIMEPNIILAVCAADVDLANSEALRASRRADPFGIRTIGVLTKMDLVDGEYGSRLLTQNEYPLELGYVGVVCKAPSKQDDAALARTEASYFDAFPQYSEQKATFGTKTLRKKLVSVLEQHMARQLYSISESIEKELEDAKYQFKVHYNDRIISPESYVAQTMDGLKSGFKEFAQSFGKQQVSESFNELFEKRILEIMADVYWKDQALSVDTFPKMCNAEGAKGLAEIKLEVASSVLTKSGVGRMTTQHVVDKLLDTMDSLTRTPEFEFHSSTRKKILEYAQSIIRAKYPSTVDQVENTIKPYKFEVDLTELEWKAAISHAAHMLEKELANAQKEYKTINSMIGRRKLRKAISNLHKFEKEAQTILESDEINQQDTVTQKDLQVLANKRLMEKAREAIDLQRKVALLQSRISAIKSRQCATSAGKQGCPEVFLSAVSQKLISTSVMFIWIELLNEFYFTFPRELENKLYYALDKQALIDFANENQDVKRHLQVQQKCKVLEDVTEKIRMLSKSV